MLSPGGSTLFPAKSSPQRLGDAAKTRAKVALKPGRSLMDWIRLGKSGTDLQGFGGRFQTVTKEELAKHNKETDCWMAIRGKVYNITPYLEFHPGGIPEILRGVGEDATNLFDEVHKWVNVESMLSSCLIGPLSTDPIHMKANKSPAKSNSSKGKSNLMPPPNGVLVPKSNVQDSPRFDWFQNDNNVYLSIYTKRADVTKDDVILDCENARKFELKILLGEKYFLLRKELEDTITDTIVKDSESGSGKFEVILTKENIGKRWEKLGAGLDGDETLQEEQTRELKYRPCTLIRKDVVTHDTYLFSIGLPKRVFYSAPIGHHCLLKMDVEGMEIDRSYTTVPQSLASSDSTGNIVHFMIKIYEDGVFTSRFGKLEEGDTVMMSDCTGNFKLSRLKKAKDVFLVAAGTGLTPMLRIITYCLYCMEKTRVKLLFANKTENDILWKPSLDQLHEKYEQRFAVSYILSQPSSSWSGMKGRIDAKILGDFLGDFNKTEQEGQSSLYCICGPTAFTNSMKRAMNDSGIPNALIHCFLG